MDTNRYMSRVEPASPASPPPARRRGAPSTAPGGDGGPSTARGGGGARGAEAERRGLRGGWRTCAARRAQGTTRGGIQTRKRGAPSTVPGAGRATEHLPAPAHAPRPDFGAAERVAAAGEAVAPVVARLLAERVPELMAAGEAVAPVMARLLAERVPELMAAGELCARIQREFCEAAPAACRGAWG